MKCECRLGRAYHVTYEEPMRSLRLRALSYLSKIPRDRLEKIISKKAYHELSTRDNFQDYEKKKYGKMLAAGRQVLCEQERFEQAKAIINNCWRVIDFTGGDVSSQARGTGLVDEIAAFVRQDMTKYKVPRCLTVSADHVLAAAECHTEWLKKDHSEMRHLINRWPWWMARKIAVPFDCPVWSVQQLNTNANAMKPGYLPNVTESAEGRGFAAACDFCFILGRAMRNGRVPFTCGKHRRTEEFPLVVLQILGNESSIRNVSDKWAYDERPRRICEKRDLHAYRNATAPH